MKLILTLVISATMVNPTYSPDSTKVAFTRDNDLYVADVATEEETRLTFDGTDLILNGYASWVYYEEILGRGSKYKSFWWSPDSRKLGFYRYDNSGVNMFPIFSPFGQDGSLNETRYPKAGETNPSVKVGIIDLGDGSTVWADFDYGQDQYFGIPFWSKDSREFYVAREPRRQNTLDLYAISAADGSRRHVYHEEYPTWLDWIENMIFTDEGFYMARNFETGWDQIYFLGFDGSLKRLTDGQNWSVSLVRADEKTGDLWFTAKRDSRVNVSLYRLDRKGRVTTLTDPEMNLTKLTFSEDGKTFDADLSTASIPTRTIRCDSKKGYSGGFETVTPPDPEIVLGDLPSPKLVKIENDGFDLYGLISYPKGFDPSKKYPVVMQLYGGPGTPYVRNSWRNRDSKDDWCFENGIIYIVVDPRSSGENGRRGMDQAFRRMTVVELDDYIAWAKWLKSFDYVAKIGVEGFSFGGTTTAMLVLRYPEYFCCGIAGGGVYDWILYDSHYTERFMDTPQSNPEGYESAKVLNYVNKNGGRLMLTHGTGDDNVHFQNTLQLIDALQKEGVQFDLMIYPDGMHGYRGAQHEHSLDSDHAFWERNLR